MIVPKKSEIVISDTAVYHLGLKPGQIQPNMILVGDPNRAYLVAERFERVHHEVKNREFVTLTGTFQNQPISVIGTGIGTDNVEIALTEAYICYEFDLISRQRKPGIPPMNIIRVGTSGGIQETMEPGTMGISSYALGLDSTGLYYDHPTPDPVCLEIEKMAGRLLDNEISADSRFKGAMFPYCSRANQRVVDTLIEQAEKKQVSYEPGITISSPGFYGPSSRYVEGFKNTIEDIKGTLSNLRVRNLRAINMEMESSLLFHLANQIGYAAGTICPVISNPAKSTALIDYEEKVNQAIDIALESMVHLNKTS